MEREKTIGQILSLEAKCRTLEEESASSKSRRVAVASAGGKLWLRLVLGRPLSRAMGNFLRSVRHGDGPILGRELAQALDAASRKLIGYKRWMLLFGLLAALPGIISLVLLYQQSKLQDQTSEGVMAGSKADQRIGWLSNIYTVRDSSELGQLNTPAFSAQVRRRAVLGLIERDAEELASRSSGEGPGYDQMVDISRAPLREVNFSALPDEPEIQFDKVSFVGSDFEDASFAGCRFQTVWFSSSTLVRTDFRGCRFHEVHFDETFFAGCDFTGVSFEGCNFEGAFVDGTNLWPEDFDPLEAGAKKWEDAQ